MGDLDAYLPIPQTVGAKHTHFTLKSSNARTNALVLPKSGLKSAKSANAAQWTSQ